MMPTRNTYARHEESFISYVDTFLQKKMAPCYVLKKHHTFRVVENTKRIIAHLPLSDEDTYCAQLIALYHDIGRFLQYEKYQTFLDKKSEDHANIAVRVLKKHAQFLQEPKHIQKKVLTAIILHNKLKLPDKLPLQYKDLCQIIRDADKIDIIKVLAENFTNNLPDREQVILNVKDDPLLYSKYILNEAMQKHGINYVNLVYANDFKILLCAWTFALNYDESIKLLKEQNHIQTILATLPQTKEIEEFTALINNTLHG